MGKKMQYSVMTIVLLLPLLLSSCANCNSVSGAVVKANSADYIALTASSNCGPLMSELDSFVEIEHPFYAWQRKIWTTKKTVAGGKLSLDQLTLKWVDDHHLTVNCRCRKETLDFAIGDWNGVAISYTFSQ